MMTRKLIVFTVLVFQLTIGVRSALADEPAATITTPVGSAVPQFSDMARRTARGSLYFLGGLLGVLALVKRFKTSEKGGNTQAISLLSRRALGGRSSLLLVEVEGRKLLLAQCEGSVSLLTALEPPFEITETFDRETLSLAHGA